MKLKKRKIWFTPIPGIGLKAVVKEYFWRGLLIFRKVLYRDLNKCCYTEHFISQYEIDIDRE